MFYNREKELGEDALISGESLWWISFWGAYSNVAHKFELRNSVYFTGEKEESDIIERWFYESVKKLKDKTEIFLKEYAKMKYEENLEQEKIKEKKK